MVKRGGMKNKFKRPLSPAKLVLEKNNENTNRGRQKLYIARNKDYHKFDVVNSCNGLVCLCDPSNKNTLVVCNPVTGEFIRLPEATSTSTMLYTNRLRVLGQAGFGFHPKTNEYKVIQMWTRHVRHDTKWVFECMTLEIHTLGTPSWKNVEVDPQISIWKLKYLTCVDGALHWISFDHMQMSILCFNFENESFQSFPSPPHVFQNDSKVNMGELRGFLYICDSSSFFDVTMWVMKEYGIGESWTKVYNIDTSGSPLGSPKYTCTAFCWPVKRFEESACIMLYDSCNCILYYEP
jgi:F-box interacting protein